MDLAKVDKKIIERAIKFNQLRGTPLEDLLIIIDQSDGKAEEVQKVAKHLRELPKEGNHGSAN